MKIAKACPFEGKPVINMPSVYGGCTGKEILFRIPVIGKRPIRLRTEGLASGLRLEQNIISGIVEEDCQFEVSIYAENEEGSAEARVLFKIQADTMLLTPLMGFTSWNAFGSKVTQNDMEKTAELLLEKGIADYGYCYMNIDSGWQKEYGGPYDAIMPNDKFPDMGGFCRRMHERGLKCGIYSTPMLTAWGCPEELSSIPGCTRGEPDILSTCCNGGIGKEHLESNNVRQWEEWGFDYLKYDWSPTDPVNADLMKRELKKAGREIALCVTVSADRFYRRYWSRNCCSWRNNADSRDDWSVLKGYMNTLEGWEGAVRQGHFYDLDMLEIGHIKSNDGQSHLTEREALFAYTLRAFFLSPIQISCRLESLTEFEFDLICNEEIIRMNQDSLAEYPRLVSKNAEGSVMVYERHLENGDLAVAVFNTSDSAVRQSLDLGAYSRVRNLWTKTDMPAAGKLECVVEAHCAVVLRAFGEDEQNAAT